MEKMKVYCCTWCCIHRVQRTASSREVQLFWRCYHACRFIAALCRPLLCSFAVLCSPLRYL